MAKHLHDHNREALVIVTSALFGAFMSVYMQTLFQIDVSPTMKMISLIVMLVIIYAAVLSGLFLHDLARIRLNNK